MTDDVTRYEPPSKADALRAMKAAFRAGADPTLVPARLVESSPEAVTSSGSPADIERTQLSFIRASVETNDAVPVDEILSRAGMNHEQLLQMTSQPGFFESFKDLVKRTIVLAKYARAAHAQMEAAEAGDSRAFDIIHKHFGGSMMDGLGEYAQAAMHGDPQTVARMIDREIEELSSMRDTLLSEQSNRVAAERMIEETNKAAVEAIQ